MPIHIKCDACQSRLRIPDRAAGKRVKCPKCEAVLQVPAGESSAADEDAAAAAEGQHAPQSGAASHSRKKSPPAPATAASQLPDSWYLKTEEGDDYGPVPKAELDQWLREGRITADCQLLQSGAPQWQWASDVYPELEAGPAPPAAAPPPQKPGATPGPQRPSTPGPQFPAVGPRTTPPPTEKTPAVQTVKSTPRTAGKSAAESPEGRTGKKHPKAGSPVVVTPPESGSGKEAPKEGSAQQDSGPARSSPIDHRPSTSPVIQVPEPHKPASPDDPAAAFAFAAKDAAPTARLSRGKSRSGRRRTKPGGEPAAKSVPVTLLAVANFVYGFLYLGCGGLFLVGGAFGGLVAGVAASSSDEAEAQGLAAFAGIGAGILIGVALLFLLFAATTIIGGIGVLMRASWGRVLTLICGGIAAVLALLTVVSLVQGNYLGGLLGLLLNGGYAAAAFALLLPRKYADEFR